MERAIMPITNIPAQIKRPTNEICMGCRFQLCKRRPKHANWSQLASCNPWQLLRGMQGRQTE